MKTFLLCLAGLLAFAVLAPGAEVINMDKSGLALQGYDPVAYFTDGKPVKGSPEFTASYKGATYKFASAEHKRQFESSPAKYEPNLGDSVVTPHRSTSLRRSRSSTSKCCMIA